MKLLTKELRESLPKIYSCEKINDPEVKVKFFLPGTGWTWYVLEFDGNDSFFGCVVGNFPELGYFSLSELESLTGPLGVKVERDMYFKPVKLSEVKQ